MQWLPCLHALGTPAVCRTKWKNLRSCTEATLDNTGIGQHDLQRGKAVAAVVLSMFWRVQASAVQARLPLTCFAYWQAIGRYLWVFRSRRLARSPLWPHTQLAQSCLQKRGVKGILTTALLQITCHLYKSATAADCMLPGMHVIQAQRAHATTGHPQCAGRTTAEGPLLGKCCYGRILPKCTTSKVLPLLPGANLTGSGASNTC